ncbi:branched-chain-amino-acid transaminase [Streptomyces sp. TRM70350]|uniref:branched-chain-amino-acid transaminase n=1 Tax=Streptomyces sp. TRM70350 TaxID=2856165 RepID=UPI001C48FDFA|nr:branched-chain-amino-acid transaminase [Streptomyces sp. TRM70350]MBV7696594.1 branched-chain-amino-acid transaminase [Streptomyces sp. TRM70350]
MTTASALETLASPQAGHPEWLWRSGDLVPWEQAAVHVNAVGHASVAAVFEGVKAYLAADGERLLVFRLDDHLRRLADSARLCRLSLPHPADELHRAVVDLLTLNGYREDTYLRPWAFPRGIIREQMVPSGAVCEVIIDSWPFRSALDTERGCRAAVSSWLRVGEHSAPPRAKAFSNYHNGRLALMEARENGHDWPVMLNERHKVSEGAGACLALVRDGVAVTPSLTSGVLPGITRDTALVLLRDLGIPVEEREVDRTELYLADEIFFMGTAWEVLPVTTIDGLTVRDGTPGPVTRALSRAYGRLVRGEDDRHPQWITEVPLS